MLKRKGKKVIFDAHEDLPNQIKSKHYLNKQSKKVLSFLVTNYEKYACSKFDAIVAATPFIRDKFLKINKNTVDINNYPKLEEFELSDNNYQKELQVCYVGGISEVRGINEMVTAIDLADTNVKLVVAGNFVGNNLEAQVKALNGWNKVDFLGYLDREGIKNTISSSIAGLVVLHPTNSYLDSLPVKMFEYMAAGVPVIASNFPLWKTIVEETNSGICVNPLDAKEIAKAIDFLINNSEVAERMGNNGKKLVNEKFNWRVEEEKLFKLYTDVLGK
jgi:glycosyltransferase involved in cell wall biosynthesis